MVPFQKAVQSFDTTQNPFAIENGIYVGDFAVLKFFGDFIFDLRKSKLEFDFDQIAIFGLKIGIKRGDAAKVRTYLYNNYLSSNVSIQLWNFFHKTN